MANVSLVEAVAAASLNPARLLAIDHKKGSIEAGKDGDLVLIDGDGVVEWVMLQGEICQM
jgi:N-acetylglucosamine-6-phosphate deacetylase